MFSLLVCLLSLFPTTTNGQGGAPVLDTPTVTTTPSPTPSITQSYFLAVSPFPTIPPPGTTFPSTLTACLLVTLPSGQSFSQLVQGSSNIQKYFTSSVGAALGLNPGAVSSGTVFPVQASALYAYGYPVLPNPSTVVAFRNCFNVDASVLAVQGPNAGLYAAGTVGDVRATLSAVLTTLLANGRLLFSFAAQPDLVQNMGFQTSESFLASVTLDPISGGVVFLVPPVAAASNVWLTVAWAFPLGVLVTAITMVLSKPCCAALPWGLLESEAKPAAPKPKAKPAAAAAPAAAARRQPNAAAPVRATAAPIPGPAADDRGFFVNFSCMEEPQCLSPDPEPLPMWSPGAGEAQTSNGAPVLNASPAPAAPAADTVYRTP